MSDFRKTDYATIYDRVNREFSGRFPNVGNKVWLQGILSEISGPDCHYEYGYDELSEEYINETYDCVLLPLANCFYAGWISHLIKRAAHIRKLRIPVYVIACGVQAQSYDELDDLVESVREPAIEFIRAVYDTGGQFALRGYFTAEFFERLGFKDAVVTGCPSLYQMGRSLSISNEKVPKAEFVASINGTFRLPTFDRDIKHANFVCQDVCAKYLYDPHYFETNPFTLRRMLKHVKRGEYALVRALANNQIHLLADTQQWMSYYVQNHISFSFGSRIHGTVMPILSGVPSLCYTCDARTKEMAEFYDIPSVDATGHKRVEKKSLYEWYCETDYSKFNVTYVKRFDAFEAFLRKCGLVSQINQNNTFMQRDVTDVDMPQVVNQEHIRKLKKKITRYAPVINVLHAKYGK